MDRLISEQAVFDVLNQHLYAYTLIPQIKAIPSADKWIPVSERMPEDREEKLVYLSSNRITIARYSNHIIPLAPYKPVGWGCELKYHDIDFETEEVVAWMPLPTPFEPQESEDKE